MTQVHTSRELFAHSYNHWQPKFWLQIFAERPGMPIVRRDSQPAVETGLAGQCNSIQSLSLYAH